MLKQWLPRIPDTLSLNPEPPKFIGADPDVRDRLCKALSSDLRIERMVSQTSQLHGHYRAHFSNNSVFLKVTSAVEATRRRRANDVAAFLSQRGVSVLVAREEIPLDDDTVVFIHDQIRFRYGDRTVEDGMAIGRLLARLHTALSEAPAGMLSRTEGLLRLNLLKAQFDQWRSHGVPPSPFAAHCERLARRFEQPFAEQPDSQMVHGDLNLTNMLFDTESGAPLLIDFEDSLVSWLPPQFDVGMALQRIAFKEDVSPDVVGFSRALIAAYCDERGVRPFSDVDHLESVLAWLCLRSFCMLDHLRAKGQEFPAEEWGKFALLAERAEVARPLLTAAFDG